MVITLHYFDRAKCCIHEDNTFCEPSVAKCNIMQTDSHHSLKSGNVPNTADSKICLIAGTVL